MPVTLPPGCARLATNPDLTGSKLPKNTIGIDVVAAFAARTLAAPTATMTSTLRGDKFLREGRQLIELVVGEARFEG